MPAREADALIVLTTTSGEEQAREIARHLVEERLAACVNIVPRIRSIYSWKGKLADDAESLLLVKTRRERFQEVRTAIRRLHSYDLPEVIAVEVAEGDPDYLAWIAGCVPRG